MGVWFIGGGYGTYIFPSENTQARPLLGTYADCGDLYKLDGHDADGGRMKRITMKTKTLDHIIAMWRGMGTTLLTAEKFHEDSKQAAAELSDLRARLAQAEETIRYCRGLMDIGDNNRPLEALVRHHVEQERRLLEALKDVMSWIENWEPAFVDDDEWQDTEQRVAAVLGQEAGTE